MPLALTDDHQAIAEVVRSFLADQKAQALARNLLDDPNTDITGLWQQMAGLGWLGLHLPAEFGGDGYGLPELAIVAEELGRILVPVPFVPSSVASALVAAGGSADEQKRWLPEFVDGTQISGLGLTGSLTSDESGRISGDAGLRHRRRRRVRLLHPCG